MSTGRNRQKHLSIGTTLFWITAWAVTFTLPYLFQPKDGAGLGPMIGFVSPIEWSKILTDFRSMHLVDSCPLLSSTMSFQRPPAGPWRRLSKFFPVRWMIKLTVSFMMEARIPTRQWKTYDLATTVARDDKKQSRFHASHIEGTAEHPTRDLAKEESN